MCRMRRMLQITFDSVSHEIMVTTPLLLLQQAASKRVLAPYCFLAYGDVLR